MTREPPPRLLAALAVAFVPARAAALLGRASDPTAAGEASRLASLARPERLDALAAALAALPRPTPRARERAAAAERPGVAARVRTMEDAPGRGLLQRLVLERLAAVREPLEDG